MKKWLIQSVCLFVILCITAGPLYAGSISTSIRIETTEDKVRLFIGSTEKLLCRVEHQASSLLLHISPVEHDPAIPREFPINVGLVKKVRFLLQKPDKLVISVDVISLPNYSLKNVDDGRGIILTIEREMYGSPRRPAVRPDSKRVELTLPASPRARKIALMCDAAGGSMMSAADLPFETAPGDRVKRNFSIMFGATKKNSPSTLAPPLQDRNAVSLRKKLLFLSDVLAASMPPGFGSPKKRAPEGGKTPLINKEFVNAELVQILKYLSDTLGLNLITSRHVKGSKSIVLSDITAGEAIPLVLGGTEFTYKVAGKFLFVGPPDIVEGLSADESTGFNGEEVIRVFVFKSVRIEKIIVRIQNEFPQATIESRKMLNALIITAGSELMEKIERFLKTLDIPEKSRGKK